MKSSLRRSLNVPLSLLAAACASLLWSGTAAAQQTAVVRDPGSGFVFAVDNNKLTVTAAADASSLSSRKPEPNEYYFNCYTDVRESKQGQETVMTATRLLPDVAPTDWPRTQESVSMNLRLVDGTASSMPVDACVYMRGGWSDVVPAAQVGFSALGSKYLKYLYSGREEAQITFENARDMLVQKYRAGFTSWRKTTAFLYDHVAGDTAVLPAVNLAHVQRPMVLYVLRSGFTRAHLRLASRDYLGVLHQWTVQRQQQKQQPKQQRESTHTRSLCSVTAPCRKDNPVKKEAVAWQVLASLYYRDAYPHRAALKQLWDEQKGTSCQTIDTSKLSSAQRQKVGALISSLDTLNTEVAEYQELRPVRAALQRSLLRLHVADQKLRALRDSVLWQERQRAAWQHVDVCQNVARYTNGGVQWKALPAATRTMLNTLAQDKGRSLHELRAYQAGLARLLDLGVPGRSLDLTLASLVTTHYFGL